MVGRSQRIRTLGKPKRKSKRHKGRKLPLGVYPAPRGEGWSVMDWEKGGKLKYYKKFDNIREATYERLLWTQGHHWNITEDIPKDAFGFIYKVTNLNTGKMYIGSKQFYYWNGPVGGYKCTDPSDEWWDPLAWRPGMWEKYTSSSDDLNIEILKGSIYDYKFDILELCQDKLELHLAEVRHMMKRDVLEATDEHGNWLYYNKNIAGKIFRPPFSMSDAKEMIEQSKEDMRNYYLKPNRCEECDDVLPFGKMGTCPACDAIMLEVGFG